MKRGLNVIEGHGFRWAQEKHLETNGSFSQLALDWHCGWLWVSLVNSSLSQRSTVHGPSVQNCQTFGP